MLDELREYDGYMSLAESGRLKWRTLSSGGFSGVERALVIIARKHLFAAGDAPDFEKAKAEIRKWCGFTDAKAPLPAYLQYMIEGHDETKGKTKIVQKTLDALKDGSAEAKWDISWKKKLSNELSVNSENAIFYDGILSEAADAGPLKKYFLVFSGDIFEKIRTKQQDGKKAGTKKSPGEKQKDLILKVIAAFLLQRTDCNQQWFACPKTDIANWTIGDEIVKNEVDSVLNFIYGNDEPLFGCGKSKVSVNCAVISEYHIRLTEESELGNIKAEYLKNYGSFGYYEDNGAGKPLSKKE